MILFADVWKVPMMLVPFTWTVGGDAWTRQGAKKRERAVHPNLKRVKQATGGVERDGMLLAVSSKI